MNQPDTFKITKSDFLIYCQAPRHLWAKLHGLIDQTPSEFDRLIMQGGYRTEHLAMEYVEQVVIPQIPGRTLHWQQTFTDGPFETRCDALVQNPESGGFDLYEIKSGTSIKPENILDVTFQALILEARVPMERYHILHLDGGYLLRGNLEIDKLFGSEDVTEEVHANREAVRIQREGSLLIAAGDSPEDAQHCFSPGSCPCPGLCHPDLPDFSIFNIPGLHAARKQELLALGIRKAADIPPDYRLTGKQRLTADTARSGREYLDREGIAAELGQLSFPLYFLDYETCISALPLYEGYHPQQQVVFQYSLHRLQSPGAPLEHFEHLSLPGGDPAVPLLESLRENIGGSGSVLVWNKTFEMTRNRELAALHPRFAGFLEGLNSRVYDLADIVIKGYYLHPGFKGSWSIKHVLPVMVPDLSYGGLEIGEGGQASAAWWRMAFDPIGEEEKDRLREALLRYCELDTLAMVKIYEQFLSFLE